MGTKLRDAKGIAVGTSEKEEKNLTSSKTLKFRFANLINSSVLQNVIIAQKAET